MWKLLFQIGLAYLRMDYHHGALRHFDKAAAELARTPELRRREGRRACAKSSPPTSTSNPGPRLNSTLKLTSTSSSRSRAKKSKSASTSASKSAATSCSPSSPNYSNPVSSIPPQRRRHHAARRRPKGSNLSADHGSDGSVGEHVPGLNFKASLHYHR